MSMVEVRHRASEALQKPSMHETAGHGTGYGYLIKLVAARLRGSKKRTHRAALGTRQYLLALSFTGPDPTRTSDTDLRGATQWSLLRCEPAAVRGDPCCSCRD